MPEKHFNYKALLGILTQISHLEGLSRPQLARIARLGIHSWGPEEFVISEGVGGDESIIILIDGTVYVRKRLAKNGRDSYEQLADLTAPTIVGEDSFFTGLGRSAGVYAREPVSGIVLDEDDFNRLISLDKRAGANFMRRLAQEGQRRVEKTLDLYINTLRLILKNASKDSCEFSTAVESTYRKLSADATSFEEWRDVCVEIMLNTREVNHALESLYHFANLPDLRPLSVDRRSFKVSPNHTLYSILLSIVEDLVQTQRIIPLEALNLKDIIIASVIKDQNQGLTTIDYPAIVSIAEDVYRVIAINSRELGLRKSIAAGKRKYEMNYRKINALLWEDV